MYCCVHSTMCSIVYSYKSIRTFYDFNPKGILFMKSIHLQQLFEQLSTDPDLSDNQLLFNEDGTANKKTLYSVLSKYGVTKNMIQQLIDSRTTDVLVSNDGVSLTRIECTTINNYVIQWISTYLKDGVILGPLSRWNGDNPPLVDTLEMYTGYSGRWVTPSEPIAGFMNDNLSSLFPVATCTNVFCGMSCGYDRLNLGWILENDNGTYRNCLTSASTMFTNVKKTVSDQHISINDMGLLMDDIATFGSKTYTVPIKGNKLVCFEQNELKDATASYIFDTVGMFDIADDISAAGLVSESAITIIGTTAYLLLKFTDNSSAIVTIDVGTEQYQIHTNNISSLVANSSKLTAEFISDNRVLLYNDDAGNVIDCVNLDDGSVEWSFTYPEFYGSDSDNRLHAMSYDPIQNYLYLVVYRTMIRYKCPVT